MPAAALAVCVPSSRAHSFPLCVSLFLSKMNEPVPLYNVPDSAKGNDQFEGIEELCPWYSWLSGVTQGQMYLVIQSPCLWYLSDIFVTVGNFLRKTSILLWLGQYQISQR